MKSSRLVVSAFIVVGLVGGYLAYRRFAAGSERTQRVLSWLKDPQGHADWSVQAGQRCGDAPFSLPTDGLVGYLWDDTFSPGHRHQGIDVFGGGAPGETPVVSAYAGYLTRLPGWKSSVIVRIPEDPLQPGRQIWTYYTHMADPQGNSFISPQFPPGTQEMYIPAGTLLGYQGDYSGDPNSPVGVHLHFSIVRDNGAGGFLDERNIANTLDPSRYLGLSLNAQENQGEVPVCGTPTTS